MTAETFTPVDGETELDRWKRHAKKWEHRCRQRTRQAAELRAALNTLLDFAEGDGDE